jgi:hypothetical protein
MIGRTPTWLGPEPTELEGPHLDRQDVRMFIMIFIFLFFPRGSLGGTDGSCESVRSGCKSVTQLRRDLQTSLY